ncbi:hypothetical protein BH11PSE3_BH11PSE3_39470 [soil metagenome]
MSALAISAIALGLIIASIAGGVVLRRRVPEAHLSGDSKEVIRLATALIGTMAALVLALLFAATRGGYETTTANVSRLTAGVTELDHLLKDYGPESLALRRALRDDVTFMIDLIWREGSPVPSELLRPVAPEQTVLYKLRELTPGNAVQVSLQTRALQITNELEQIRLVLFAQSPDSLSKPFMIVLVLWLMFIFASFSMSAEANPTLVVVLVVCALSAASAIYLILELDQPFDGLMQISVEPLRRALVPLPLP